jgi:hypothetical protein
MARPFLVPFRRLLRLAGSQWRYSTPPPHGFIVALTLEIGKVLLTELIIGSIINTKSWMSPHNTLYRVNVNNIQYVITFDSVFQPGFVFHHEAQIHRWCLGKEGHLSKYHIFGEKTTLDVCAEMHVNQCFDFHWMQNCYRPTYTLVPPCFIYYGTDASDEWSSAGLV